VIIDERLEHYKLSHQRLLAILLTNPITVRVIIVDLTRISKVLAIFLANTFFVAKSARQFQ
ncbi:hypothetical protein, partial [Lentilactobacillus buchneri]|uniref:hypothetical protein n=1 Tax=Lentilactobacillus buchneri TaxID=1581 RepID=UPI0021A57DE7